MESDKRVFLLLNGEPPRELPDLSNYDFICATDGACDFLERQNIIPDLITGDFDSAISIERETEVIHSPDQNFTDFYKALQILHERGYFLIDVFGSSGNEQDHFIGNLNVAIRWKDKLKLTFFDNYGRYFLIPKNAVLKNVKRKTISLIPFPFAKQVISSGLQFPLKSENLSLTKKLGIRNKAISDQVNITFKTGELFVFIND